MKPPNTWEIPGHLSLSKGNGGMDKLCVQTPWSSAEIYLHGAHVTHFQKKGEPALLFLSEKSQFTPDQPIRGGIPIIFPWFGPRDGLPASGFARRTLWEIQETRLETNHSVRIYLKLPTLEFFEVDYFITVGETLTLEMRIKNHADKDFDYENCLHTYFKVSDINTIRIAGLRNARYDDKVTGSGAIETAEVLKVDREVDRVYFDNTASITIQDPGFDRLIHIKKSGSNSTVVWNPWISKSKHLSDLSDHDYLTMLCVESGNVTKNKVSLPSEKFAVLKAEYSTTPLG